MKILVVGSGGREHALLHKLSQSPRVSELVCIPGNAGTAEFAQNTDIPVTDTAGIVKFAANNKIDLVVVGPELPLTLGLADMLEAEGIPVFGPSQKAAEIEGSKAFSKALMQAAGIPTAGFEVFESYAQAESYIKKTGAPIVIKADGLAAGKGVVVAETVEQACSAARDMLGGRFGKSGNRIVAEEFLQGPEVSVLCLCDGKKAVQLVSAMDHKRALDGDRGENTGGMGSVAPNPFYTPELRDTVQKTILDPVMKAMSDAGRPFKGCLFAGLMLTPKGPYVIEFNCRFGDPETQSVLALADADFAELFAECAAGGLSRDCIPAKPGAAACVVLASGGYPGEYVAGLPVAGLDSEFEPETRVYHAATRKKDGETLTCGGRVFGVTAVGDDMKTAVEKAYRAADKIDFEGKTLRRDIGAKAL